MANATTYNIELRDKSGNLKDYLTPIASNIKWEWNRIGGCGKCKMTLKKGYRDVEIQPHDDIQIRVQGDNTWDTFTKMLLHCDGTGGSPTFIDEIGHTMTAVANAQIDTAQKKFGTGSGLFDGTGDYVSTPDSADWTYGTGDFTIEFWMRFNAIKATNNGWYEQRADSNNYAAIGYNDTNNRLLFQYYVSAAWALNAYCSWTPVVDTWYHVAFVRSGSTFYMFIDGVSQSVTISNGSAGGNLADIAAILKIGSAGSTLADFDGWLDEVRISKGVARWTSNFTPPTAAYTPTAPSSKLAYRGYVEKVNPQLSHDQKITLDIMGYFGLLQSMVVQASAGTKTYTDKELSEIVDDIADTFITPNSDITKGTIDVGVIQVDTLGFRTTVADALKTLAELSGDVEYGVDENLVFFWRTEDTTVKNKFFVGADIKMLERRFDWTKIINKIYFQGADVSGSPFLSTRGADDSQTKFFLSEKIITNSAVSTDSVADQYIGAILKENSKAVLNVRARIPNTDLRIEDTVPLGEASFYDKDYAQDFNVWGKTASGGSNRIWGTTLNGGSNQVWGSIYHAQINRISYELSETSGRFNIEIQLGDTILETAARIKRLELDVSNLRQRS